MIITLKADITQEQYKSLLDRIKDKGLEPNIDKGTSKTVVGLRGIQKALKLLISWLTALNQ